MKAFIVEEVGGSEKFLYKDVPIPEADEGMVLVKNHFIVGLGVAGFEVGDHAVVFGDNAYSESSVHKVEQVAKIPIDKISYQDAAAVFLQGLTAVTLAEEAYTVKKGGTHAYILRNQAPVLGLTSCIQYILDTVLIHAAAGGAGLVLVQICHYLVAIVIGTVSTRAKADLAREYGANHVINYTEEDVVTKVNEFTNGFGCYVVYDSVGKDTIETSLASARRFGTVVVYGLASGPIPPIMVDHLTPKNLKFASTRIYTSLETAEGRQKWQRTLFYLLGNGRIKPHIYKIYDFKGAAQAHIDLETRKSAGKLLLKP